MWEARVNSNLQVIVILWQANFTVICMFFLITEGWGGNFVLLRLNFKLLQFVAHEWPVRVLQRSDPIRCAGLHSHLSVFTDGRFKWNCYRKLWVRPFASPRSFTAGLSFVYCHVLLFDGDWGTHCELHILRHLFRGWNCCLCRYLLADLMLSLFWDDRAEKSSTNAQWG